MITPTSSPRRFVRVVVGVVIECPSYNGDVCVINCHGNDAHRRRRLVVVVERIDDDAHDERRQSSVVCIASSVLGIGIINARKEDVSIAIAQDVC